MKLPCTAKGSNSEAAETEGGCFRPLLLPWLCTPDRALPRRNETLLKWPWSPRPEGTSGHHWATPGFSRPHLASPVLTRPHQVPPGLTRPPSDRSSHCNATPNSTPSSPCFLGSFAESAVIMNLMSLGLDELFPDPYKAHTRPCKIIITIYLFYPSYFSKYWYSG